MKKIVRPSSTAVYGAWANNPVPITEDTPLRPSPAYLPAIVDGECERLLAEWAADGTGRIATRLRIAPDRRRWRAFVARPRSRRVARRCGCAARRRRCRSCTSTTPRPRSSSRPPSTSTARTTSPPTAGSRTKKRARCSPGGRMPALPLGARDARARRVSWATGARRRAARARAVPRAPVRRRERPAQARGLEAAALERRSAAARDRRARSRVCCRGSPARARSPPAPRSARGG